MCQPDHSINEALNEPAAEAIFRRYAQDVRRVASQRLDQRLKKKVSPEDVVQSVFRSFFRRKRNGEFQFQEINALWGLLLTIAVRKCSRVSRDYFSEKRNVRRETVLSDDHAASEFVLTPHDAAALKDVFEWSLLEMTELQKTVVLMRLANYSSRDISVRVGRTQRTIRRILEQFRQRLDSKLTVE